MHAVLFFPSQERHDLFLDGGILDDATFQVASQNAYFFEVPGFRWAGLGRADSGDVVSSFGIPVRVANAGPIISLPSSIVIESIWSPYLS